MKIASFIKELIIPPVVLHDLYGDYVKRKAEKVDRGWPVDENTPLVIQRLLKEGWAVIEPDRDKLKSRGDIAMPGPITKEKCKMSYKDTGYWSATVDPAKYEQVPEFNEFESAEAIAISEEDIIESDTWEDVREDQYEMVDLIDKLQIENTDLKHTVEYYEKYVKWLEDNYIFILRSPKSLKEDFDKIIGGKDNE